MRTVVIIEAPLQQIFRTSGGLNSRCLLAWVCLCRCLFSFSCAQPIEALVRVLAQPVCPVNCFVIEHLSKIQRLPLGQSVFNDYLELPGRMPIC